MHYICIIMVIYIMYTNVRMLVYVIEPKREKGKSRVYLKDEKEKKERLDDTQTVLLRNARSTCASRRTCCSESEYWCDATIGGPNFLYTRQEYVHFQFLNVLRYSVKEREKKSDHASFPKQCDDRTD